MFFDQMAKALQQFWTSEPHNPLQMVHEILGWRIKNRIQDNMPGTYAPGRFPPHDWLSGVNNSAKYTRQHVEMRPTWDLESLASLGSKQPHVFRVRRMTAQEVLPDYAIFWSRDPEQGQSFIHGERG
jgi:hypothetical protein